MSSQFPRSPTPHRVIPIAVADDSSAVVSLYQSDEKIYARGVSGWFNRWRWAMVWITQLVFYGLPWLSMNGRQAVLFDLVGRRFYIFNLVLYPQDLIYLTGLLVICALSLFLFTAVAGRLWCGYACPQTVYTEIFMWIERKTEGDRNARMRRDNTSWSLEKLNRKCAKHTVWIGFGLWTGFTFVGYFTPINTLAAQATALSMQPWALFWVLFYGFATYANAGWMREQVCKYMCPYARFQSAMFDRDTLIVTYDAARGEGRGSRPRSDTPEQYHAKALGDCIDCGLCVQVCPTGIDIREGLQYECISCSACVDVCNSIMEKMHYPLGLISNTTQNGLDQKLTRAAMLKRVWRPRVLAYAALLTLVTAVLTHSILTSPAFRVDVVRDRGAMARVVGLGKIENVYRLQIMNATEKKQRYTLEVRGISGAQIIKNSWWEVDAADSRWVPVRVQVPPSAGTAGVHPLVFVISTQDKPHEEVVEKSVFLIPH